MEGINGTNRATWSTSIATDDAGGDGGGGGAMHGGAMGELARSDSAVSAVSEHGQADGDGEGEGEGEGAPPVSRSGSRALDAPLPPPDARQNAICAMMAMAGEYRSPAVGHWCGCALLMV